MKINLFLCLQLLLAVHFCSSVECLNNDMISEGKIPVDKGLSSVPNTNENTNEDISFVYEFLDIRFPKFKDIDGAFWIDRSFISMLQIDWMDHCGNDKDLEKVLSYLQPIFRRNQEASNFILIFREGQKAYRSNTSSTLSSASDDDQEQDDSCSSSYNDGQDHFPILSQNAATDKKEFVWRFLNKQFSELKQDNGKFTVNEDLIARITILFNLSDGLYEKRDLAYTINYLCEILKKGENLELTSVESDKLSSKVNQMSNVYINHYLI